MSEKTESRTPTTPQEAQEWIEETICEMTELHLALENKKAAKLFNLDEEKHGKTAD